MKISKKNEGTSFPFWVIIDPRQNFRTDRQGVHNVASMFTGVWLSRESALEYLKQKSYNFSDNARVYCLSGYYSSDWQELPKELKKADSATELLEALQNLMKGVEGLPPLTAISGALEKQYKQAEKAIKKATK